MADYVLVHGGNMTTGTWNKLTRGPPVHSPDGTMGAMIWDPIVGALRAHDHRVFAPTLMDEHHCNLTGHIEQVCELIAANDVHNSILVGHSYGGMIITGVAARMPDRIRRLVYVDAAVPDPGQSLFDIIVSSGSDPLSFTGLEPAAPYVEKLQFDAAIIRAFPKTYILCINSEFLPVTQVAHRKIAAEKTGWTYIELPSSHVPMASMPDETFPVIAGFRGKLIFFLKVRLLSYDRSFPVVCLIIIFYKTPVNFYTSRPFKVKNVLKEHGRNYTAFPK